MIYFLHPGIVLIIFALLSGVRARWQTPCYILAPIVALLSLMNLSLNADTHEILILSLSHEQVIMCASILIILFANNIYAISTSKHHSVDLKLSLIYSGAGLFMILSQNLIVIFLSLELMMLAGAGLIFNGHNHNSKSSGLNYLKMHILSGTLFLIGIITILIANNSASITNIAQEQFNIGYSFLLIALLINIALPPFSFWLTEGYPAASPFGSTILTVCMTKISAMIIAKIFLNLEILIYLGVFMGIYGVLYMMLETHLRKMITFSMISETGIILIAIGAGNLDIAMSIIISNIFYVALLMMCASYLSIGSEANHFYEIKKIPQAKLIFIAYVIALFSISAFPLTVGYINKEALSKTLFSLNKHWVIYTLNIINSGIILTFCFKTINFIFFYKTRKENITCAHHNIGLYILILAALTCSVMPYTKTMPSIINSKIIMQLLLFGALYFLFSKSKKLFFFTKRINLIEPDFIYRQLFIKICNVFALGLSYIITMINDHQSKLLMWLKLIKTTLVGQQGILSYSKYVSTIIILTILILIFFLIQI